MRIFLPKTNGGWFGLVMSLVILFGLSAVLVACGGTPTGVIADNQVGFTLNPRYVADSAELPYAIVQQPGETLSTGNKLGEIVIIPSGKLVIRENPKWAEGTDSVLPYIVIAKAGDRLVRSAGAQDISLGGLPYGYVDDIVSIGVNEFGVLRGGAIKQPGVYTDVPNSYVTKYPATVVGPNQVGMALRNNQPYFLAPGYNVVNAGEAKIIPVGRLRYRTLKQAIIDLRNNPDANEQAKYMAACASYVCESSLDKSRLSGSNLQVTVDVDIQFHFVTDASSANTRPLWNLGNLESAVQTYIGSSIRAARTSTAKYTQDQIQTAEAWHELADTYKEILAVSTKGVPIVVDEVLVRYVQVGDDAYQAALVEQEKQLAGARNEAQLLELRRKNEETQRQLDNAKKDNDRQQALLDADNQQQVNQKVLGSIPAGMSPCLYLAAVGKELPPACTELPAQYRQPAAPAQ